MAHWLLLWATTADPKKMASIKCQLCGESAFYPCEDDDSTIAKFLIEHVRDDINYAPIYCTEKSCAAGSWTSRRLFDIHCLRTHPDKKDIVPIDKDDDFLARQISRIAKMAFPEVLGDIELLEQYSASEDAATFDKALRNWDNAVHQQRLFKTVEPRVAEPTNETGPTPLQQSESEVVAQPEATAEAASTFSLEEAEPPVMQSPMVASISVQLEEPPPIDNSTMTESTPVRLEDAPRIEQTPVVHKLSVAPPVVQSPTTESTPEQQSRPPRHVHDATSNSPETVQHVSTPQIPGKKKNCRRMLPTTSPKRVSNLTSTIQFVLDKVNKGTAQKAIVSRPAKKPAVARPRRRCALCPKSTILYLKTTETKHAYVHLRRDLKEFRFECLVCKNLKTIFDDVIKVRHLPDVHQIRKKDQKEGLHFRDYTIERGIVEKRNKMRLKCFPPTPKKSIAQACGKAQ